MCLLRAPRGPLKGGKCTRSFRASQRSPRCLGATAAFPSVEISFPVPGLTPGTNTLLKPRGTMFLAFLIFNFGFCFGDVWNFLRIFLERKRLPLLPTEAHRCYHP